MYNGYKTHNDLEPQYAGSGSLIAGCAHLLYTGSKLSTKGFLHLLHMPVHFAQLSLTWQFHVGGHGGYWKFRSAPASPLSD